MEITLQVNGRKMTFSENELTTILEDYFSKKETKQKQKNLEGPKEEIWFKVDPLSIDQRIFQEKREDKGQEMTRQGILIAFEAVNDHPDKYARKFETLMPKKTWFNSKTADLKELAYKFGDHMADLIEAFLELAQRIANGESWEKICNIADEANYCRMVQYLKGEFAIVGGSRIYSKGAAPSNWNKISLRDDGKIINLIPLVVRYCP